jgi:CubicO group peptidase (beta-lactamase class C family)
MNRRKVLKGITALSGLGTFVTEGNTKVIADAAQEADAELLAIVDFAQGIPQGVMGAGLIVARRSGPKAELQTILKAEAGLASLEEGRAFTIDTPMRVASISKLGVALYIHKLAEQGRLRLDDDASLYLGFSLRNPHFPKIPIQIAHLLSHTSTIVDHEPYWALSPDHIKDLFVPEKFTTANGLGPGLYFTYTNINYGLLGTIIETVTGQRFDEAMGSFLGGDMGYGWSGVSREKRQNGATLYRRSEGGEWRVQADGSSSLNSTDPVIRAHPGFHLSDYRLGTNGTLFGPQGGLRASLVDLISIAQKLEANKAAAKPYWIYDRAKNNGDTEGGFYHCYGKGPFILPAADSPIKGHALIGHHGQAYGLYAGLWTIPSLKAVIAMAFTGTPEKIISSNHPAFTIWEAKSISLAARALGVETTLKPTT